MIENDEIIVLKSTYNKTPGMVYLIEPCKDKNGRYPSCIRPINSNGDMILSEDDIKNQSEGKVFLPVNEPIAVTHNSTFNLADELQSAQWEAIKNSKLIAKERDEKDAKGNFLIDGDSPVVDKYKNPRSRYGLAELYIERPGRTSKYKNDLRKLKFEATQLVMNDDLAHQVLICRLFEKFMEHSNPNDVLDFLLTKAEKDPNTIIKYYKTEESSIRLLLLSAIDREVITKNLDGLYYSDIRLGSSLDTAAEFLKLEGNKAIKDALKKDTFPEMVVKTQKSTTKKES